MKSRTKKFLLVLISVFCVAVVSVSAYLLFFRNAVPFDYRNLLDVYIPQFSPDEYADELSAPFLSSLRIYKLNEKEIQKADADISSNNNWKKYIDSDYEVIENFNMLIFNSDIEPDLENCYLAFFDYGAAYPDLPLSVETESDENIITFSSFLLAVYDKSDGKYYFIDNIL